MKILFATEYYHPFTPGGTPWSLALLAQALGRRGHAVAVVTPSYGAALREDVDGVPVFRFPVRRTLAPGPNLVPVRDHVSPLFHLRMARAVLAAARRTGADVVHAQEKHALVGAYLAARRLGRPVFLSLRDYGLICPITTCLLSAGRVPADCGAGKLQRECAPFYLDRYIAGGRLRRLRVRASLALLYADARLKGALVRRVDGVVGVSRGLLDIYGNAGRIPPGRAHVVYNVPPPWTAAPSATASPARRERLAALGLPDGLLVLYAGKLSLGKGFPVFVEAARAVAARFPGVAFAAAGAGEPAAPAPVHLLGSRPHAEMRALYDLADVVVQPAVWPEPFSRVPLEAAAAGKPVVATRVGGMAEAVEDRVTGLLVEPGDPRALAQGIGELLADEPLRRTLGRQAAEGLARFAPDRIADHLLAIYRAALPR
jgi:glycosyltransferase involved in cell wall biosynthesis